MARWNTAIERASAPISSRRSAKGTATSASPAATASVTRVMALIGCATPREMISAPATASITAKPASRLSCIAVLVDAFVDAGVNALRALGVMPAERFQVFAQLVADLENLVFFDPIARGLRAELGRDTRNIRCQLLKIRQSHRELAIGAGIAAADAALPIGDHDADARRSPFAMP